MRFVATVQTSRQVQNLNLPDPYDHDINLNSFKTSVAPKVVTILQNLIKTNHLKSGKSKYDRKLTKLDVVTTRGSCTV